MTLNDLEWLVHGKMSFRPEFLESERLNVRNSTTGDSAVFCALHDQLASLGTHAQLTRCFSAVAELVVKFAACRSQLCRSHLAVCVCEIQVFSQCERIKLNLSMA